MPRTGVDRTVSCERYGSQGLSAWSLQQQGTFSTDLPRGEFSDRPASAERCGL